MTPAIFIPNAADAFELFIGMAIGRAEDLYELDGETAFRRCGGRIETFDIGTEFCDLDRTGGQS